MLRTPPLLISGITDLELGRGLMSENKALMKKPKSGLVSREKKLSNCQGMTLKELASKIWEICGF